MTIDRTADAASGPGPRFALLGSFECSVDDDLVPLRGPLQERLAAYLLLNRQRIVPVSRLVETIWEDGGPDTAAHQVRKMTSDLRKRVPGLSALLQTSGAGYRMSVPVDRLDVAIFTQALQNAREAHEAGDARAALSHLRRALGQWRGPVLNGEGGPVIGALGTAIEERRQSAQELLFSIRLGLGEADEIIGDLRDAVAESPLREALRGQLMRALFLSGRQTEALAEFQQIRRLLDDEYGVEPGTDLTSLHQQILRNDLGDLGPSTPRRDPSAAPVSLLEPLPATVSPSPTTLPYDLPDFTGRDDALQAVFETGTPSRSAAHRLRIVLIDGMPGSGKSALAIHAAHQLHASYPDGRLYLDLHGFTRGREPVDTYRALGILLSALGLSGAEVPADMEARVAQWRTITNDKSMLLVLDDARSAAQIRPLLPSSPESLVLVTSRYRIADIDGARMVSLGTMPPAESLALLEHVLGRVRVAAEPEAALRLAVLCGHLPLALRISAARLLTRSHWSIGRLVSRLADETRRLSELVTEDRSVLACIRSSLEALPPEQVEALRLFCLHPGEDLEIYAAAALAGRELYGAEDIIEFLLDHHLMESRSAEHYTIHGLVRATVLDLRDAGTDERDSSALDRLLDYYRESADRAASVAFPSRRRLPGNAPGYQGVLPDLGGQEAALAWLDAEYRNILPTLALAAEKGGHGRIFETARDLLYHLHFRGRSDALLEAATLGMNSARASGDPVLLRMGLVNLAVAYWRRGEIGVGMAHLHQALGVAEVAGDVVGQAVCLNRLGTFYTTIGEAARAVEYLERCIPMHRESGDIKEEAEALFCLSAALNALRRYDEAAHHAEAAIAVSRNHSNPSTLTMTLINLGTAQTGLGQYQQALASLGKALDLDRRLGGSMASALILARFVPAYRLAGDLASAERFARGAAKAAEAGGTPPTHRALVLNLLGEHELDGGHLSRARILLAEAHTLSEQLGLRQEAAQALARLADAHSALGADDAARQARERAESGFTRLGIPYPTRP